MTPQGEQLTRKADEELLPLVADADPDAFEVFYERHADAAFALAHRICGSGAAADDVCQEAFVDAWRSAGRYDARLGSARGWLLTIVHHRAIDQIRRSTRLRDRTVNDEEAAERVAAADDTERAALETAERARGRGPARHASRRAAPRRVAGLLLRLLAQRDRRASGHPAGHDQVAHEARSRCPSRPPRGRSLGMSACSDPQMNELLGAYLLGACANDEADAVRDHIASCPVCASEVAELVLARDALLNVTPTRAAPPQLKERVMAQVRADAELFAAAGGRRADAPHVPATASPARRESRLRSWLRSPASLAAAAACALVLIVGGALIGSSIGGDEGAGGSRTVLGKVAAPGGSAQLVIDDAGTAHLVVSGLPDPGRRRVYQVWLQTGKGAPVPTKSLFSVTADGSGQTVIPGDVEHVDQVMVTSEPDGGSMAPTSAPVVAVSV